MISIRPYYEREGVKLYHADVLKHLYEFRTQYSAITITDPPYNTGQIFAGEVDRRGDYEQWSDNWLSEALQIGHAVVFTPGYDNLPMWHRLEIPDGMFPMLYPNVARWEPVLVYGAVERPDACRNYAGCRFRDDEDEFTSWHPCPKPEEYYREAYRRFAQEGEAIFEPFAGSGTALRFALRNGLDCVAFEDKEAYCERIARGLEALAQRL